VSADPPLRVLRADEIDLGDSGPRWLIEHLWPDSAVGVIGGQPKSWKSWLGLELAVAVASGTPCLGRYACARPGPALVYLAEDALRDVRARIECLARSRRLSLEHLDLKVIAEPVLRLDQEHDRRRLQDTVAEVRPRLLVLDPLVRLHALDENSSQEVSALLSYLRALQREHDVAIALVHHTSKRAHARHGQALRGTGDIHAWTDVGLYLTWQGDQLHMTTELRTARPPEPIELRLVADDPSTTHLAICGGGGASAEVAPQLPLAQRVMRLLEQHAPRALRRGALRDELRVNNASLGEALEELERLALLVRSDDGWRVARRSTA
jgi:hypothetical protein